MDKIDLTLIWASITSFGWTQAIEYFNLLGATLMTIGGLILLFYKIRNERNASKK